ncbi:hypothetical protein SALBM311S_10887 [Streptomyces alboniger]
MTADEAVARLASGMTLGIGGWGSGASRWPWSERCSGRTSPT